MNPFLEGILYATVLGLFITISQVFNNRLWLRDYPASIRKEVPPMTNTEKRMKLMIGIPFLMIMLGYPIMSTIRLKAELGPDFSYMDAFVRLFILTSMFNLFDLLVLDWLIFSTIRPDFLCLEGTEGMKDYRNYLFHLKAAGKGLLFSLFYATIIAMIMMI